VPGRSGQLVEQARPAAAGPLLPSSRRPITVAVLAACIATTVVLGAWFAGQNRAGWPDRAIDARIRSGLAGHGAVLSHIALIGNPIAVSVAVAVLCALCLAARNWRGAVLVTAAPAVAGALTEYALKPLIGRILDGYLSMPSGHTAGAFSLAAALAVLLADPRRSRPPAALRAAVIAAAVVVAGSVAIAMVGMGAHYFTDTVAGAAVGTGAVLGCALLLDLPGRRPEGATASGDGSVGQ